MNEDHIVSIPRNAREELRVVRQGDRLDLRVYRQDGKRELQSTPKGFVLKAQDILILADALVRANRKISGGQA